MQACSNLTKHLDQKTPDRSLWAAMKNIRDMAEDEKVAYWKYIRGWQKLADAEAEIKEQKEAMRIAGIRFCEKKEMKEECDFTQEDARVQSYPQAAKTIETKYPEISAHPCIKVPTSKPVSPTSKPVTPTLNEVTQISKPVTPTSKPATPTSKPATPTSKPALPTLKPATSIPHVFPIYSHGTVCGYFCSSENKLPPQKVALTNFRSSSMTQNLPDRLMAPQIMNNLNTVLLNNNNNTLTPVLGTRNTLPLLQTVNIPQMMRVGKALEEPKPVNSWSMVPIQPAPVKIQYYIPATIQNNNIRLSGSNLLCVATNSNNQNKTNVVPTLLQPVGCNAHKGNSQATFLRSENQNGNAVSLAHSERMSSGKRVSDSGKQGSKQNCKLKKIDPVCIKTEASSYSCSEKNSKQLESDVHLKNSLSPPLSVPAPDVKTEMPDEDENNSISYETEQENDCGLVISSFFSLSKANALKLGLAYEIAS